MDEMFYIVCVDEENDFWNLRLKGSHTTLACTHTKKHILECLYAIVKRYKGILNLKRAISTMEQYNEGSTNMALYEEQYEKQGHLYEGEVTNVIREALDSIHKVKKINKVNLNSNSNNKEETIKKPIIKSLVKPKETIKKNAPIKKIKKIKL